MSAVTGRRAARDKRHERIRLTLTGSGERPRLAVFRSLNQIYAQVIDDSAGATLASASSLEKGVRDASGNKTEHAKVVGRLLAERAKDAGVKQVFSTALAIATTVASRALADAAREAGLDF